MKLGTVYFLRASDDPEMVRYIGSTIRPLSKRLSAHKYSPVGKLKHWVKELQFRGAKLEALSLGQFPVYNLQAAESFWIDFCSQHFPLLNLDRASRRF